MVIVYKDNDKKVVDKKVVAGASPAPLFGWVATASWGALAPKEPCNNIAVIDLHSGGNSISLAQKLLLC